MSRDTVLSHVAEIVASVDLPVNADFESGYAHDPDGVAESVRLCVETGVAGLSIEDSTGDRSNPLYDLPMAVERMKAARAAIGDSGVLLVGRAECFLVGHAEPLKESIRRLQAYAEAGADVLYAPGVRERADIRSHRVGGKSEAGERAHEREYRGSRFPISRKWACEGSAWGVR